jgi:2-octaprenyl-6-methoxyphenol hydroxylase
VTEKNAQQFDLIIIGAGMVGASLVHLLKPAINAGMKVALVERFPLRIGNVENSPPSFDGRATALSFGTRTILQSLGVWQQVETFACAIEQIQVSEQGKLAQAQIKNSDADVDALGFVIRNQHLGQGLLSDFPEQVALFAPQQVQKIAIQGKAGDENNAELLLESGEALQAQLVVLADGGRSGLAKQLGIEGDKKSYQAHALVSSVKMDRGHNHWAYERFTQAGPLAMLPLADDEFALVWTLPDDEIEEYLHISDDEFIQRLQKTFGYRAGNITAVGERASYPLALQQAKEQVRPHLVLLGNAAHGLHPVAGQGFNLALRDTAVLAEKINQAFSAQDSIGSAAVLQSYLQQQSADQRNTILASDALPRLFSQNNSILSAGRSAGLLGMAAAPVARKLFARHAMGLGQKAAKIISR